MNKYAPQYGKLQKIRLEISGENFLKIFQKLFIFTWNGEKIDF